jgi:hypothetical protein
MPDLGPFGLMNKGINLKQGKKPFQHIEHGTMIRQGILWIDSDKPSHVTFSDKGHQRL